MDRSKKSGKNSVQKKNGNPYDYEMKGEMPLKKLPGKKKDKNWKNHLLDSNEEDEIDLTALEDLNGFEDSGNDEETDEL